MRLFYFLAFCFGFSTVTAQIPTPEKFLGYTIGTRFTPHHRLVDYCKALAAAKPSKIKYQQYGVTNEGRPLVVMFVSSPQNISNLEAIRQNNLSLTNKKDVITAGQPVIVWLSYNVHGNEPSSSEAAMLTLAALTDDDDAAVNQYLRNTVVVVDPCLNPDGRDRYVNWYNSVVSKTFDPSPAAREHSEPWPRGRTNHYNFDLNRDWAWQTQVESQARLALYNQWMPQVHVDFHEQGYNEPYYFAPAAEPFHEVITKWQRDFQTAIGRNHARYFDEKGWLYFTRERFDLLYPSYGDTYPIYNGSIGMTYEQGGINAGLGVLTNDGDTLTLVDRAQHHFTTSISTIEVASKNAANLLSEFQKYFTAANAGVGEYKTYVIKMQPNDTAKMNALVGLLQKNGIQFYAGNAAGLRGLNYDSGREESFAVNKADLVISSAQPKSNLVKVLFEATTVLSDSATYDITAWSLPFVYGLKAFATKSAIPVAGSYQQPSIINASTDVQPYAYVIPWNGMPAAALTGALIQKGIKLRFATTPFESGGQQFGRGAIIILKTSNQAIANLWATVRNMANQHSVKLQPVRSGFVDKGLDFGSNTVVPMANRRVALFTGEGISSTAAGEVWHYFDQSLHYPVSLVNASDAARIDWNDYDVVIMPDGMYRFLSDKNMSDAFRNWINSGGNVIALEGAVLQLSKLEWSIKARKTDEDSSKELTEYVRSYEARERDALTAYTPGAIFKVELDNTHPLAFGYPNYYYTLKQDNAIYDYIKENGWNVGVLRKDKPVAGFVGNRLSKKLQNGLLFGVQEIGRGTVTYLTDNILFRNFWENGKLLFANAVFFVGQ